MQVTTYATPGAVAACQRGLFYEQNGIDGLGLLWLTLTHPVTLTLTQKRSDIGDLGLGLGLGWRLGCGGCGGCGRRHSGMYFRRRHDDLGLG